MKNGKQPRDFFKYGEEGGFWELIFFSVKFIILVYIFIYIGALAMAQALQDPIIIDYLCK